jgi:katanin p60 ATPase-containing subunit A1
MTTGYSGADISNVCRDAAMIPLRRKIAQGMVLDVQKIKEHEHEINVPLVMQDFLEALKNVQKSVSQG